MRQPRALARHDPGRTGPIELLLAGQHLPRDAELCAPAPPAPRPSSPRPSSPRPSSLRPRQLTGCFCRLGPINAKASCLAVRTSSKTPTTAGNPWAHSASHMSTVGSIGAGSGVDCSSGCAEWKAMRQRAACGGTKMMRGPAGHWLDAPSPDAGMVTVSDDELAFASSSDESDGGELEQCADDQANETGMTWTRDELEELDMDDLMEQIRQLALWVSEPGAKRTIQVSS